MGEPAKEIRFTDADEPERFIPVSKKMLIDDLMETGMLAEPDRKLFRRFSSLFSALLHHRYHRDLEQLKEAYRPFSPDPETVASRTGFRPDLDAFQKQFIGHVEKIFNDANYERLAPDEINKALKERSPYGLTLYVDLNDFDELLLCYRGLAVRSDLRRTWKKLYFGKERIETPIYKRLALVLKLKSESRLALEYRKELGIDEKAASRRARRKRLRSAVAMDGDAIYLKLFKDIPRSDLEMLFPTTRVRMNLFDKIKIGITGGGGIIFGLIKVLAALLATTTALTFGTLGILVGFFGMMGRQVVRVFNLRTKYMVKLSQNLYMHSLDNNAGVFTHLIVVAEEEEWKEAILAYFFLGFESEREYDLQGLDRRIEQHIRDLYGVRVNFEIQDALKELRERGILIEEGNQLRVLPLEESCRRLDREWDSIFEFP